MTATQKALTLTIAIVVPLIVIAGLSGLSGLSSDATSGLDSQKQDVLDEVRQLIQDGSFGEAESRSRECLQDAERRHGRESAAAARVLDFLVEALWRGGKASRPESRALAERALRIKREKLGVDHADLAISLDNLGMIDYGEADYAAAKARFEQALVIRRMWLDPVHPDIAWSLSYLGVIAYHEGQLSESRGLHEQALAIREATLPPDHIDLTYSLNNLAILSDETGDYVAARRLYERALAIIENALGPDNPRVAGVLNNLAVLLVETGDYATAKRTYERALAIRRAALDADHPWIAETLTNIANLQRQMGNEEAAKVTIGHALAIWKRAVVPDHLSVASSLDTLAELEYSLGNYTEAKKHFGRAIAIWTDGLGPDHASVAWGLSRLANVLKDMGDLETAKHNLERGIEIWRVELGAAHPYVGTNLEALAEVHFGLGAFDAALTTALEAEKIGRGHLRLFARGLAERQSLRYALVRASGLDMALSLSAAELDGTRRQDVLDAVVRSRALVLDETASRHRMLASTEDAELLRLGAKLASARTRLANLVVRNAADTDADWYRMLLDQVREEKERAERELADKSDAFRRDEERREFGLSQVTEHLPSGSALVSYALYRHYSRKPVVQRGTEADTSTLSADDPALSYVAFVLRSSDARPDVVALGRASEIDRVVGQWQRQVSRGPMASTRDGRQFVDDYHKVGEKLRKMVWDPVVESLRGAQLVFLVPDGSLNLVSFAALPAGSDRYVIETGPTMHYLSAERDLVSGDRGPFGEGLLAVGNPDFSASDLSASLPFDTAGGVDGARPPSSVSSSFRGERSNCVQFSSVSFPPLRNAAAEVKEIAELWRARSSSENVVTLEGRSASEDNFKARAPGKRGLHLATHGFFLGGECPSAWRWGRGVGGLTSTAQIVPPEVLGENPLLLSGLAFAGANHRDSAGDDVDDGILTAEEVAAMDLSGVEWAVLSACDTGAGEVMAGEGVLGLRRAFEVAGARTLIMSLWPVSDESTRSWMRRLYEARLAGLSTSDAIRRASIESLQAERRNKGVAHPFFWAPFVAVGDWR